MDMWKRCLLGCTWILLAAAAMAQEVEYPKHNCAFTPPEGWVVSTEVPPRPELVAVFNKLDRSALVMVLVDEKNIPEEAVNDHVISEFERGIVASGGGPRIWGRRSKLGGVEAYDRLGQLTVAGKPASVWMRMGAVSGASYSLQAMRFDGTASEDAELQKALDSFRFLHPPQLLPAKSAQSAAYRAGYWLGYLGSGLFCFGLVVAIPVIILLVVRKRKHQPPIPPPYPPRT